MSSDPGTSNDSGGKDTQTPFGTASSTKTKTKFGYSKPKSEIEKFKETGGVVGALTKPVREKTEEVNRKFYEEKVKPSGKSKAPDYETYMKDRLAGKTDAYGNLSPGYRRETVKVRKADGTMTTKEIIVGGNDKGGQTKTKTTQQIEAENVAAQKAAQAEADQAAAEQADAYKKKRLSITSSRSLFGRAGGRGFYN